MAKTTKKRTTKAKTKRPVKRSRKPVQPHIVGDVAMAIDRHLNGDGPPGTKFILVLWGGRWDLGAVLSNGSYRLPHGGKGWDSVTELVEHAKAFVYEREVSYPLPGR